VSGCAQGIPQTSSDEPRTGEELNATLKWDAVSKTGLVLRLSDS